MDNSNNQLAIKYQKVATEYSKIRAQVSVLKRAVVDEQIQNSELKENLKEKEVELRKSQQELDSLTFRNQQLTKRVTVLQEDLDQIQSKSKKGKSKFNDNKPQLPTSLPNNILDEEFQKKIIENAQLLSQLNDRNTEIDNLNEKIQQLEYELDISERNRIQFENKYKEALDKAEKEKTDTQRKLTDKLLKQEETISWSSYEGQKGGLDLDVKLGLTNNRLEPSPFSSPSTSRRSSKSTLEMGQPKKGWSNNQEEINNNFEFTKYCDIERELNHWKSRYNIIKIKYEELSHKESNEKAILEANNLEPIEMHTLIGKLKGPFPIPEEIEAREAKVKEYFLQEINRLINEKQLYHSKNLAIAAENEVMNAHLNTIEQRKEKCEAELSEALSKWSLIQDEKDIQEGNYKSQLSSISEHLANMNEKLVQQTDEIQRLKYELSVKNGKRGK